MKIFVTGGTGFIGSHFIKSALNAKIEVVALRRIGSHAKISLEQEPKWVEGDLKNYPTSSFSHCDTLVHLAAHGVNPEQGNDWDSCILWNVEASLALWRNAVQLGVKRLIICGSCFEYGKSGEQIDFIPPTTPLLPQSPYAASKAAATMLAVSMAASYNIEVMVVRPFHVFGEGEDENRLWPSLRKAALSGEDFPMTYGDQVRDFTPVSKIADDLLEILQKKPLPSKVQIKNLGTGTPRTLLDFCTEWWTHWRATGKLIPGALAYRENEVMRYVPII